MKRLKKNPESEAARDVAEERAILARLIEESGGLADPEVMHHKRLRLEELLRSERSRPEVNTQPPESLFDELGL